MQKLRKGADKWLLLLFPIIFIGVITGVFVLIWIVRDFGPMLFQ